VGLCVGPAAIGKGPTGSELGFGQDWDDLEHPGAVVNDDGGQQPDGVGGELAVDQLTAIGPALVGLTPPVSTDHSLPTSILLAPSRYESSSSVRAPEGGASRMP